MRDGQFLTVKVSGLDKNEPTSKPYVLLVHGIGGNHNSWFVHAIPFLKDFVFIVPNLRGFGYSQNVPYNSKDVIKNFAEDLEDVIEAVVPQGEKVILAGLSMGAYISLKFLEMTKSRRVSRYLNVDQSPKALNTDGWELGMLSYRQKYILPRMQVIMNEFEQYLQSNFEDLPEKLRDEYFDSMSDFFECAFHRPIEKFFVKNMMRAGVSPFIKAVCAHKFTSYYHCLWAYINLNYDFRPMLKTLNIPVTVHIGAHSVMYPAAGQRYISDTVPNLTKCVVFDESHALMYTAPIKFHEEFKEFLYNN
jgi:pimeloyl-ACP methyl ester carboxylesterase